MRSREIDVIQQSAKGLKPRKLTSEPSSLAPQICYPHSLQCPLEEIEILSDPLDNA